MQLRLSRLSLPERLSMVPDGTHLPALDGLRAASILLVIAAHTLPLGPKAWDVNRTVGAWGMSLFFSLSGFLIVSALDREPDVGAFLVKRFARIVPAMFLYLACLAAFFGLPTQSLFFNAMFASNYLTDGLRGGPVGYLWSICVEAHFYVAIAIAVAIGGRRAVWLVVPAALLVTGMRIEGAVVANIKTHLRVDEILAGGILALVHARHGTRLREALADTRRAAWALLLVGILLVVSSHRGSEPVGYLRPYFAAGVLLIVLYGRLPVLQPLLNSGLTRFIAKISYALYIWHGVTIYGFMNTGSTLERYLFKRPVSFVVLVVLAYASTVYLEVPIQRLARRALRKDEAPGVSSVPSLDSYRSNDA